MTTKVEQEIELKFTATAQALPQFREQGMARLQALGWTVNEVSTHTLVNTYYDTPDQQLKRAGAGLRIRVSDKEIEQTLKTRGQQQVGIEQRQEINLTLKSAELDLDAIPASLWPEAVDKRLFAASFVALFTTDFTRTRFLLEKEHTQIELVFDQGTVSAGQHSMPLCEIEMELWQGEQVALLSLASWVMQDMSVRLCNISKAGRGYFLLQASMPVAKALPDFIAVDDTSSTEQAFLRAVDVALSHWQWHEDQYVLTQSPKLLEEIAHGIRLLLQTVTLFLPVLQCPELLQLHRQCIAFAKQWDWVETLHSLRYLLSKKSLFTPFIAQHPQLQSYLQGRKAGLLHSHQPDLLICLPAANDIKITLLSLRLTAPWRGVAAGYDAPIAEHARGWLSQSWQLLHQAMPAHTGAQAAHYIAVSGVLQQSLTTGFLVGHLYASQRGDFRLLWADILLGTEELKALLLLQETINDAEMRQWGPMQAWVTGKISSLLFAIDRTREQALARDIYWTEE